MEPLFSLSFICGLVNAISLEESNIVLYIEELMFTKINENKVPVDLHCSKLKAFKDDSLTLSAPHL